MINSGSFNVFRKVESVPIRDKVASEIRRAIFAGVFKAGEELPQSDIAEKMGVSKTPVREAIQILKYEGLVEHIPHRGAFVKAISTDYVREHYEMRILLEGDATRRVCGNSEAYEQLLIIHKKEIECYDNEDLNGWTVCNEYLHKTIWHYCGNSRLETYLFQLWMGQPGDFGHNLADMKASCSDHCEIIKSIGENDPEIACELMHKHLTRAMQQRLNIEI